MNKTNNYDCVFLMLICGSLWCLVLCSCMSALDVNNVCSGRGRDLLLFKYINLAICN